eukprot:CAMPEP_0194321854 /NCGR_PEP_ID=MMETSP0171-20130528/18059_1 /TAXON_ID=218684 /ORGANISM="Corethron pennatum, Strain L29A3" /LENGTH=165 /DNA_ID=CAMNT_0039079903 /DNA_START=208 /DNA_END=702 /DNA_ORIENTATION=+
MVLILRRSGPRQDGCDPLPTHSPSPSPDASDTAGHPLVEGVLLFPRSVPSGAGGRRGPRRDGAAATPLEQVLRHLPHLPHVRPSGPVLAAHRTDQQLRNLRRVPRGHPGVRRRGRHVSEHAEVGALRDPDARAVRPELALEGAVPVQQREEHTPKRPHVRRPEVQ